MYYILTVNQLVKLQTHELHINSELVSVSVFPILC